MTARDRRQRRLVGALAVVGIACAAKHLIIGTSECIEGPPCAWPPAAVVAAGATAAGTRCRVASLAPLGLVAIAGAAHVAALAVLLPARLQRGIGAVGAHPADAGAVVLGNGVRLGLCEERDVKVAAVECWRFASRFAHGRKACAVAGDVVPVPDVPGPEPQVLAAKSAPPEITSLVPVLVIVEIVLEVECLAAVFEGASESLLVRHLVAVADLAGAADKSADAAPPRSLVKRELLSGRLL